MKWSDGSYLEDQDMWCLSGIFRDVYLLELPKKAHISDYHLQTPLQPGENGTLEPGAVKATVHVSAQVHISCDSHLRSQASSLLVQTFEKSLLCHVQHSTAAMMQKSFKDAIEDAPVSRCAVCNSQFHISDHATG
jgi:beta-galactosidase/beta-glucuronidase